MPAPDLTLTTVSTNGTAVINVTGELDLSTVASFDTELQQSLGAGPIVVVLSECTFIDSSALQALVRAQRAARVTGSALSVVAPSQPARRVLEVAALDRVIPVFETVAEAITSDA